MARIGIIIPVYNVENYVKRCIESILNQTFQDFEVVLIDDSSTDKSGDICDEYARSDKRIVVIHKENEGPSAARNCGLDNNNSEYIVFVDADDSIDRQYLEIMYQCVKTKRADIGICGQLYMYEGEDIKSSVVNFHDIILKAEDISKTEAYRKMLLSKQATVCAWGKIYHRNLFCSIRYPVGELYEDCGIIDQIIEKSSKIVYIPYAGYLYWVRQGSITHGRITQKHIRAIDNVRHLSNFILAEYPELEAVTRAFFLLNCMRLFSAMVLNPEYEEECSWLRKEIAREQKGLIWNPYIDFQTKCSIECLRIGTLFYKVAGKCYFAIRSVVDFLRYKIF